MGTLTEIVFGGCFSTTCELKALYEGTVMVSKKVAF